MLLVFRYMVFRLFEPAWGWCPLSYLKCSWEIYLKICNVVWYHWYHLNVNVKLKFYSYGQDVDYPSIPGHSVKWHINFCKKKKLVLKKMIFDFFLASSALFRYIISLISCIKVKSILYRSYSNLCQKLKASLLVLIYMCR